jgi:hypothetical protein
MSVEGDRFVRTCDMEVRTTTMCMHQLRKSGIFIFVMSLDIMFLFQMIPGMPATSNYKLNGKKRNINKRDKNGMN